MPTVFLFAMTLLFSCSSPWSEAQEEGTIEAFERYITENPTASRRLDAEIKLEDLYLAQARESKELADYDTYLERFPTGMLKEKALEERESILWNWAQRENTVAGYEQYLSEYPQAPRDKRVKARRRMNMVQHQGAIELADLSIEQVNLANDPDGPLNGWGFFCDVKNIGEQPIETLFLQVDFLDSSAQTLDSQSYPLVDTVLPGRGWAPDEFKAPLQPGQSRTWRYTTGDLPPGWTQQASVAAVHIKFVGE